MEIKIRDIGKNLGLRKLGEKYRIKIEEAIASGDSIVLNFEGVESVSSSFADELIAKLFVKLGREEFKKNIKLLNTNNFVQTVIKATIRDRVSEAA